MREHHKREESFALDDRAFHKTLLAPIKNPLTKELSDAFWQVHMTVLPPLNIELPEDVKHTIDAHQAMVEALHAGNAKKFNKLVDKHYAPLRNSIARYAKLEQNNPNDTA
ncbi:FCD domain-containing protein [Corynebacterium kutscheri]|nr:FCD domain-containing protein [Corynebacterium kutscheri]